MARSISTERNFLWTRIKVSVHGYQKGSLLEIALAQKIQHRIINFKLLVNDFGRAQQSFFAISKTPFQQFGDFMLKRQAQAEQIFINYILIGNICSACMNNQTLFYIANNCQTIILGQIGPPTKFVTLMSMILTILCRNVFYLQIKAARASYNYSCLSKLLTQYYLLSIFQSDSHFNTFCIISRDAPS